ncbi:MAG: DNA cytosine methyltransferase [Nanoarchaeota archaeon]|nr:DNA cytosine methyltransferase [Nanoarchaeota archaeon]
MKDKIKLFDAFTGYGGASWGLKKAGVPFEVVGYSEVDEFAIKLYELNHKKVKNFGDITRIKTEELPDFDFFTGGFPCQTFSSIGKGEGELDPRGTLFYDIIRICEAKKPTFVLLENVKGLTTNSHKPTFDKILSELKRIGYNVQSKILNTKDYGIPQNRERVWIFATLKDIPKGWHFEQKKKQLIKPLKDFLDKSPSNEYYLSQKQIRRLVEVTGVDFNVKKPLCFDRYNKKIKEDGVCMTLTEPHHNIMRIVELKKGDDFQVRKITPEEHFRLMGFDDGEIDLDGFTYNQLCNCASNGWDVNLVSKIMKRIYSLY